MGELFNSFNAFISIITSLALIIGVGGGLVIGLAQAEQTRQHNVWRYAELVKRQQAKEKAQRLREERALVRDMKLTRKR